MIPPALTDSDGINARNAFRHRVPLHHIPNRSTDLDSLSGAAEVGFHDELTSAKERENNGA